MLERSMAFMPLVLNTVIRELRVLSVACISIKAACLTAITGPSGCGKSTLMYILAGLLVPRKGRVTALGHDLFSLDDAARSAFRARNFGFVFQDFALDNHRSIIDNVLEPTLYAGADKQTYLPRAMELLDRFAVAERPDALPIELSGGQAQRVALARALLLEPKVIFADEPTGNLDSSSASIVFDALEEVAHTGASVLVVTHDERVRERCEEVVDLESHAAFA